VAGHHQLRQELLQQVGRHYSTLRGNPELCAHALSSMSCESPLSWRDTITSAKNSCNRWVVIFQHYAAIQRLGSMSCEYLFLQQLHIMFRDNSGEKPVFMTLYGVFTLYSDDGQNNYPFYSQ
jgi:hypothetical protein